MFFSKKDMIGLVVAIIALVFVGYSIIGNFYVEHKNVQNHTLVVEDYEKVENNFIGKDKVKLQLSNGKEVVVMMRSGKHNRNIRDLLDKKVISISADKIQIERLMYTSSYDLVRM